MSLRAFAAVLALALACFFAAPSAADHEYMVPRDPNQPWYLLEYATGGARKVEAGAPASGRGDLVLEGGVRAGGFEEEFLRRAGPSPTICMLTTGELYGGSRFNAYADITIRKIKVENLTRMSGEVAATIEECDGFYFENEGADDLLAAARLPVVKVLTPVFAAAARRFESGAPVAASGQGAAILGRSVFCDCDAKFTRGALIGDGRPDIAASSVPGLGYLADVAVDPGLLAYGRLGRHMIALADGDAALGLGLDPGAGVVIPGDPRKAWRFFGHGAAAIVARPTDAAALKGFRLHLLQGGDWRRADRDETIVDTARQTGVKPRSTASELLLRGDPFLKGETLDILRELAAGDASAAFAALVPDDGRRLVFRKTDATQIYAEPDGGAFTLIDVELGVEDGFAPPGFGMQMAEYVAAGIAPIAPRAGRGDLILEGGGRRAPGFEEEFLARAGDDPLVCVVTSAGGELGPRSSRFDGRLGLRIRLLYVDAASANGDATRWLKDCTAYYFEGGYTQLLSDAFLPDGTPSEALTLIRRRWEDDGIVVAGSSAGAMIMGESVICNCGANDSASVVAQRRIPAVRGFGFLTNLAIDTHFDQRGSLGRAMVASMQAGGAPALGLDEATAVLVPGDGSHWRVFGRGAATLLTPSRHVADLRDFGIARLNHGDAFDPWTGEARLAHWRMRAVPIDPDDEWRDEPATAFEDYAMSEAMLRLAVDRKPMLYQTIAADGARHAAVVYQLGDGFDARSDDSHTSIVGMKVSVFDRIEAAK